MEQTSYIDNDSVELWKYIDDTNLMYMASTHGRIKSCSRVVRNTKTSTRIVPEKILVGGICGSGYIKVQLCYSSKKHKWHSLHRLIAQTFIENTHNKEQVDHIDGNKLNNRVSNLRWATHSENQMNPITTVRKKDGSREKPILVYSNADNSFLFRFRSRSEASRELGINKLSILGCIKNNKQKNGYLFRE